jgi:hypothetical protein
MRVATVVALAVSVLATAFALQPSLAKPVTSDDLVKAQENPGEWLTYSRDYRGWRYSPLAEITPGMLPGLRRSGPCHRGQFGIKGTLPFRDGVLYFSADMRGVRGRWQDRRHRMRYEPNMSRVTAMLCCGPIHRGIALKDDLVILARPMPSWLP